MTDIHSCSYYCDRPECIKAQRDELRDRLAHPEQEPMALVIDGVLVKSELPEKYTGHLYTAPPQRKPPQFPTMLRKMWSGAEVQKWINENWEQA